MIRKILGSRLASFAGGAALGAVAMLFAFPYLFPPPVANDPEPVAIAASPAAPPAPAGAAPSPAATAPAPGVAAAAPITFRFDEDAPGRDPLHWANGTGRVVRTDAGWVLRLDASFRAGGGPDFWVYLNTRAVGEERDFLADPGRVKLERLRSFEGAQNYRLPAGLDPTRFHAVTIWCERFSMYIGSAAFARGAAPGTRPPT